jgi:hypothetical protein
VNEDFQKNGERENLESDEKDVDVEPWTNSEVQVCPDYEAQR